MPIYDLLIIGGGASGLMCAGRAAELGLRVAVLEKSPRPGRKILISGGGKCNVGNRTVSVDNYLSANKKFCLSALARFAPDEMARRLAGRGIRLEEREHGQLFCRGSSEEVLDYLLAEMASRGAELFVGVRAAGMEKRDGIFVVRTKDAAGQAGEFRAKALALACGGPACPQCGASADGQAFAARFGHSVIPPAPALAPLAMPGGWPLAELAGISLTAAVSLPGGPRFTLPLLFTHRGVSGPAALQISSYWKDGLALSIDFLPGENLEEIKEKETRSGGKALLRNMLSKFLPDRLAARLLPEGLGGKRLADLSKKDWRAAADLVHKHQVVPEGTEGWKKAESSTGGVNVDEVSSTTMESRIVPGLYFCGEVLDVCGHLGGYNLHWAWASGHAAAEGAACPPQPVRG